MPLGLPSSLQPPPAPSPPAWWGCYGGLPLPWLGSPPDPRHLPWLRGGLAPRSPSSTISMRRLQISCRMTMTREGVL